MIDDLIESIIDESDEEITSNYLDEASISTQICNFAETSEESYSLFSIPSHITTSVQKINVQLIDSSSNDLLSSDDLIFSDDLSVISSHTLLEDNKLNISN